MRLADATAEDRRWVARASAPIGGPTIVAGDSMVPIDRAALRIAWSGAERVGFLAHDIAAPGIVRLLAVMAKKPGQGTGKLLTDDLISAARATGAQLVLVEAAADNVGALRFYAREGFQVIERVPEGINRILAKKGVRDLPANPIDLVRLARQL